MPVTRIENFGLRNGGRPTEGGHRKPKRSAEKVEEKVEEKISSEMVGELSDGEGSDEHEAVFVDASADTEVDLRLPPEERMPPDKLREDVPASSGVLDPTAIGQDDQHRFTPRNGAKPKWPGHELSWQCSHLPRAAAQVAGSGRGCHRQGTTIPAYTGPAHRRPDQPSPDEQLSPEVEHCEPNIFCS